MHVFCPNYKFCHNQPNFQDGQTFLDPKGLGIQEFLYDKGEYANYLVDEPIMNYI